MPDIDVIRTTECPQCRTKFPTFDEVAVEIVCAKCNKNLYKKCVVVGNKIILEPCDCQKEPGNA